MQGARAVQRASGESEGEVKETRMAGIGDDSEFMRRYRHSMLRIALAMLALAVLLTSGARLPGILWGLTLTQWHTILESFSIVICGLVFGVCWNTSGPTQPRALLILGCASLGALVLDLAHTLSFVGMPDLVTPNSFGKAWVLYFSARILIALALVAVALLPWQAKQARSSRYRLLAAVSVYVVGVLWMVLALPQYVPFAAIRDGAIPLSKVLTQLGLVVVFLLIALRFRERMFRDRGFDGVALFEAALYMALGELCFTQVDRLNDAPLLFGHVLKVLGFIRIYRAIFVEGIRAPYENLAASQALLRKSEEDLRTITDNLPAMIAYVDKSLIYRFANKNYERWLGLPEDSVVGRTLSEVIGQQHAQALMPRLRRALRGETLTYDYQFTIRKKSQPKWMNITYMPHRGPDGDVDGIYVLTLDVTERRMAEDHAAYIARHDELTGLPNRLALKDALREILTSAETAQPRFALLFIDLDRFKTVNDTLGHDAGDKLLQIVANRLREVVRGADLVARMGGDEMCVLLRDAQTMDYAAEIAQRLRDELGTPVELTPTMPYRVTVSIGIAMYPGAGADGESLLKNADIAMYQAKAAGRDQSRFFQLEAEGLARRRMEIELGLQSAVAHGELVLLYQLILDVAGRRPVGIEALLRWNHPARGQLAPVEFIGVAEEMGLIGALGEWVLNSAARTLAELDRGAAPGLFMAVNISARQFQNPALVAAVESALSAHGIAAARLHLELTESAMMDHPEEAKRIMVELKSLGVGLSVDDFGTGYSSLAYLKRFPVDCVKIDRSFVQDLPADRDDAAIAAAIIAMGHSLGLNVVAEGVETEAQLAFLAAQGCELFQGYLDSQPLGLSDLLNHLSKPDRRPEDFGEPERAVMLG
jgi:diguanylate cyclase (GGDEF)-like protein/PAS domain S-box-containing protein